MTNAARAVAVIGPHVPVSTATTVRPAPVAAGTTYRFDPLNTAGISLATTSRIRPPPTAVTTPSPIAEATGMP